MNDRSILPKLNFTCRQADISTIRPSLSGHQSNVSSMNGMPAVAEPLRSGVVNVASLPDAKNNVENSNLFGSL